MSTDNLNAYQNLLRGREQLAMYNAQANALARHYFKNALVFDPRYSPACAGIARTYNYDWQFSWGDGHETSLDDALDWANKAVQYDRSSARGHAERGFTLLFKRQTRPAIDDLKFALSLNPNDADTMAEMSEALMFNGQVDEAIEMLNTAMRINPYYPDRYLWYLADALYAKRDYQGAIEAIQRMTNTNVGFRLLAASHAKLGQMTEARQYAEQVLKESPDFTVSEFMSTQPNSDDDAAQDYADGLLLAGLPP